MGRHKWLFLLCLLLALGFVLLSGSYLRKTMVELGVVSYWKTRTYENLTPSKDQVKANALITTNPHETVMTITQRGTSIHELNNDKTYLSDSLVVCTRWDRRVATPTPGKTGTTAPPTTPPDKRGPTWFLRDDTYTKSKCPSAIRKNPEKVPEFIPDIPVLMWNDHINPEEYARLQQFKQSYGWKDMSYEHIENCLRHFNTSAHRYMFPGWTPDHTSCIRCAVVGNGGILKGSGKGKEIDEHDFVWRVNAAITKGFEDDVGKRTSFYFHCVNSMMRSVSSAHQYGFRRPPQNKDTVYVSVSKGRRDYEYMDAAISWRTITSGIVKAHDPPYEYGVKPANTKFRMLHPDFTRYLKYHWLNSSHGYGRFEGIYQPSKGAVMLLTALHTCDVTSAYGFLTSDYRQYSNHYYEKDWQKFEFYANHDFKMEMKLWDRLDKAGLMTLYRGIKTEAAEKN